MLKALSVEVNRLLVGVTPAAAPKFVGDFADPYAARVIAIMLGLPEDEWEIIARESATIGLAMGVTFKQELPRIEAALARLFEYADAAIAEREANPREDFMSAMVEAKNEGGLSADELRDAVVLMIFGGYDTTRNQGGLVCVIEACIEFPYAPMLTMPPFGLGRAGTLEPVSGGRQSAAGRMAAQRQHSQP